MSLFKRILGMTDEMPKVTVETVPAAPPPLPEVAAETKEVQVAFIQKLLQLERRNSYLVDATAAAALSDVNGIRK